MSGPSPHQNKGEAGACFVDFLEITQLCKTQLSPHPQALIASVCQAESSTFGLVFLNFKKRKALKQKTNVGAVVTILFSDATPPLPHFII